MPTHTRLFTSAGTSDESWIKGTKSFIFAAYSGLGFSRWECSSQDLVTLTLIWVFGDEHRNRVKLVVIALLHTWHEESRVCDKEEEVEVWWRGKKKLNQPKKRAKRKEDASRLKQMREGSNWKPCILGGFGSSMNELRVCEVVVWHPLTRFFSFVRFKRDQEEIKLAEWCCSKETVLPGAVWADCSSSKQDPEP